MNAASIKALQAQLGLPQTGVFDSATSSAMSKAVASSLSKNKDVATYAGANDPLQILNAYTTGDWSGVVSLSGKPFTDEQQQAAVADATKALAPAYEAQQTFDTAGVEDTLRKNQEGLADFETDQARQFGKDKDALDQNAADNGVLFSGARIQKQRDLRTGYETAEQRAQRGAAENATETGRSFQYAYGNKPAASLSSYYQLPGASNYNAGVAHGAVTPSPTLSSAYDPSAYNFQGTKPVAQKTAIQTRAASLLANKANKLTLSGVGAKF